MAIAYNYFEGWTEAQLLAARSRAQKAIASGNKTVSFTAGDVTGSQFSEFGSDWALRQIALALYEVDSDTYPIRRPITRTKAVFST